MYCNGLTNRDIFGAKLDFDIKIIPYQGNDSWIDDKIIEMQKCLMSPEMPSHGVDCDFCTYNKALKEVEG